MSFTLYSAVIPSYQQILRSVAALLDKAESFCAERKLGCEDIIQARLAPDMLPFSYQVKSTAVHSLGAIEGVRRGVFSPDMTPPPETFPALKTRIADTLAALEAIDEAEVNGFVGRDMRFAFGDRELHFTAENFLVSFSLPNFYFHATTAYDIMRWKGVEIGKRDYTGRPRTKPKA
jgi:uncharacterized protein